MTSFRTQGADKQAGALGRKDSSVPLSRNAHLLNWVEKMANLTNPEAIHWVDGSVEENEALCAQMVATGTFTKLNEELWPGCYYARFLDCKRCCAGRRSHLHLFAFERSCWADQQLGRAVQDAQASKRAV